MTKTQGERGRVKRGLSLGVSNVVVWATRETVGLFTAKKNTYKCKVQEF
jgi:hypothetical protein